MTTRVDPEVAQMEGPEAPPRKNGELVFDALWEGRAFGMAVALNDRGLYPWREFRDALVAVIAEADATGGGSPYYERFLAALEQLAIAKGMVSEEALDARTAEFAAAGKEDDDHDGHEHVGSGPHLQRS
ncbi:MAG: nitrile hydratase accessory protein [Chloroflexota bacterium]